MRRTSAPRLEGCGLRLEWARDLGGNQGELGKIIRLWVKISCPSEHPNPHQNSLKLVVHLPQNGTIGVDPRPGGEPRLSCSLWFTGPLAQDPVSEASTSRIASRCRSQTTGL